MSQDEEWSPGLNRDVEYFGLTGFLNRARNQAELEALVERNLTQMDQGFVDWLLETADEVAADRPEAVPSLTAMAYTVERLLSEGDYGRAEFDEADPGNPKEVVLSLARRVEGGEIDLETAVEGAVESLSAFLAEKLAEDWTHLTRSIVSADEKRPHVVLAELIYRIGRGMSLGVDQGTRWAVALSRLAEASEFRAAYDYKAALQSLNRVVAVGEECADPLTQVTGLAEIGAIYQNNLGPPAHPDHLVRAEGAYTRALRLCDEGDLEPKVRAMVLLDLGQTLARQGREEGGIAHLEECLALRRSLEPPEPKGIYDCLVALAQAHEDAGGYEAARRYIQESMALAPDDEARAWRLVQLSRVLAFLDETGAEGVLEEAARLADAMTDTLRAQRLRSPIYGQLGAFRAHTGDYQGAIDAYREAVQAAIAAGNEAEHARWLSNLSQVYMILGQREDAAKLIGQASEAHVRWEDDSAVANASMNLGNMFLTAGQAARAAEMYAVAFVLFHRAQQPGNLGGPAFGLSHVYEQKGDLEKAEVCLRYTLSRANTSGTLRQKGYALGKLADLQAKGGRMSEARAAYREAINTAQGIGDLASEQQYRVEYGSLLEGDPATRVEAEAEYRRAVTLMEGIRGRFRGSERRAQFQVRGDEVYTPLVRLLAGQRARPGAAGEALSFAERARSRTFGELLSRTPVRRPAGLPEALTAREAELLAKILRLEESDEVGLQVAQQHARLNRELEEVWEQIAAMGDECRDYVDLRRTSVVDWEGIVRLLGV